MTSKEFHKKFNEIAEKFSPEKGVNNFGLESYNYSTIFGTLSVRADPTPKIKVYTVFMRFHSGWDSTIGQGGDHRKFKDIFPGTSDIPSPNGKWNIHTGDAEITLEIFEERLDNMEYLKLLKS